MSEIVLYLMNEKGFYCLSKFLNHNIANHNIKYVVSARDKNVQKDFFEEISTICKEKGVKFYERKSAPIIQKELVLAIGWRWIVNTSNLIVFHDSLLPKYRGFSPVVNALINGDNNIGVTALFASEDYDEGEIIGQKKLTIHYPIKIQQAIEKLSILYFELFNEIIHTIIEGAEIKSYPQNEIEATYSVWRNEADYIIDWNDNADNIKRFIDALGFPYKGASSYANGKYVRVLEAEVVQDVYIENRDIGKVLFSRNGCPVVICGKGLLMLAEVIDDELSNNILPFENFRVKFSDK